MNCTLNTYDGDQYLITEAEKIGTEGAIEAAQSHVTISRLNLTLAVSSIKSIELTTEPIAQNLIGDPTEPRKLTAIPGVEDDSVQYRWLKKLVTHREYEKQYGGAPGYRVLEQADNGLWLAFKRVRTAATLPSGLQVCSTADGDYLDGAVNRSY